ncbi:MAG: type II toxin-antitoxin system VapC family toxin [Rhizobiaceae bacterium]|nr:type II toxin-antitoxin system VapC family toxin [Rhizobiaceae bacterium]
MSERLVADASVAIKWLVPEPDWSVARSIYAAFSLVAPELICAECANILWKKHRRNEISRFEVLDAIETIAAADIELVSLRDLTRQACELSLYLDHPAYDCFYLALAIVEDCRLVTADDKLLRVVGQRQNPSLSAYCAPLRSFGG